MLSTAIVIFREAVEISLILGIVLAATRSLAGRLRWIAGGFAAGVAGAGLVALSVESISAMAAGMGQELFNALILTAAALMIGWTVLWMHNHVREMTQHLKQVGHAVAEGKLPLYSLSLIIALAILREGSEIVMFVYGMVLSGQSAGSIVAGSALGVALGVGMGVAFYYGLLRLSTKHMLRVTTWLLVLLVAGLASQAMGFLHAAGYFAQWSSPVWDSSWLLAEDSVVGFTLHSLIGYSAQPSAAQLVVYCGALLVLVTLLKITKAPQVRTA